MESVENVRGIKLDEYGISVDACLMIDVASAAFQFLLGFLLYLLHSKVRWLDSLVLQIFGNSKKSRTRAQCQDMPCK